MGLIISLHYDDKRGMSPDQGISSQGLYMDLHLPYWKSNHVLNHNNGYKNLWKCL